MKDWIKGLNDQDFKQLFKWEDELQDAPQNIRDEIVQKLEEKTGEKKFRKPHKWKNRIKYGLVAAVLICILLPVSLLFIQKQGELPMLVSFLSGETTIIRDNNEMAVTPGSLIQQGDILSSAENTRIAFQEKDYYIRMEGLSEVQVVRLTNKVIELSLKKGTLVADNPFGGEKISLTVVTSDLIIQPTGTHFLVNTTEQGSQVAVIEGRVKVSIKNKAVNNDFVIISIGELFSIDKKGNYRISGINDENHEIFEAIDTEIIRDFSKAALLEIESAYFGLRMELEGKIYTFDYSTSLLLNPGEYTISIKKNGYEPYEKKITLKENENEKLFIELIAIENGKPGEWRWEKVYTFPGVEKQGMNSIISLVKGKDCIVAVTRTAIMCLKLSGRVRWEYFFEDKEHVFNSRPVIFNNTLYISSQESIVILELVSGECVMLPAPGTVNYGYTIGIHEDKLYAPYPAGIIEFDPAGIIDFNPAGKIEFDSADISEFNSGKERFEANRTFSVQNPVTPVFSGDKMVTASFSSAALKIFDLYNGEEISTTMESPALTPPIIGKDGILCGDSKGNIYLFDNNLKKKKTIKVPAAITSLMEGPGNYLYTLANDGWLYSVTMDGTITPEIEVDTTKKYGAYFNKSPIKSMNKIFIGNEKGELLIIDYDTGIEEKKLPVSSSSISSSCCEINTIIFAGTAAGEIYRLEMIQGK